MLYREVDKTGADLDNVMIVMIVMIGKVRTGEEGAYILVPKKLHLKALHRQLQSWKPCEVRVAVVPCLIQPTPKAADNREIYRADYLPLLTVSLVKGSSTYNKA